MAQTLITSQRSLNSVMKFILFSVGVRVVSSRGDVYLKINGHFYIFIPLVVFLHVTALTEASLNLNNKANSNLVYLHGICLGSGVGDYNYFSIGQQRMKTKFQHLIERQLSTTSNPRVTVEMYGVRTNKQRMLAGWLHVDVYFRNRRESFNFAYIQLEDENGNAIGEFMEDKHNAVCSSNCRYRKLVQEFYFPCGAGGHSGVQVSQGLNIAQPDTIADNVFSKHVNTLYGFSTVSSISFTWRFSHYSCNKPEKIRLRGLFSHKHQEDIEYYRSPWYYVGWVGASDIIMANEVLDCHSLRLPDSPQESTNITWIMKVEAAPNIHDDVISRRGQVCKPAAIDKAKFDENPSEEKARLATIPSFGGRCELPNAYSASYDFMHKCTPGKTLMNSGMDTYLAYLERRKQCMKVKSCPCKCPGVPILVVPSNESSATANSAPKSQSGCRRSIKNPLKGMDMESIKLGFLTDSPAGKNFLKGRKAHGIVMILATMTVTPVNIMVARYFKESWLKSTPVHIKVWYFVHVIAAYGTLSLYLFGLTSLSHSKRLLGTSNSGIAGFHRGMGIFTILLYVFSVITGPLRPVQKTMRDAIMRTHAVLGIMYYFSGMITIIASNWIPGSPSASNSSCHTSGNFVSNSTHLLFTVVGWILVDTVIHLCMTRLMLWADKRLRLQRRMYFPIIPILLGHEEQFNMKGFRYRNTFLIMHGLINAGITTHMIVNVATNDLAGCGFGSMTCSHSSDGNALASLHCGLRGGSF